MTSAQTVQSQGKAGTAGDVDTAAEAAVVGMGYWSENDLPFYYGLARTRNRPLHAACPRYRPVPHRCAVPVPRRSRRVVHVARRGRARRRMVRRADTVVAPSRRVAAPRRGFDA